MELGRIHTEAPRCEIPPRSVGHAGGIRNCMNRTRGLRDAGLGTTTKVGRSRAGDPSSGISPRYVGCTRGVGNCAGGDPGSVCGIPYAQDSEKTRNAGHPAPGIRDPSILRDTCRRRWGREARGQPKITIRRARHPWCHSPSTTKPAQQPTDATRLAPRAYQHQHRAHAKGGFPRGNPP
jgi:hypothetical protein